jgi:hypothetical protein
VSRDVYVAMSACHRYGRELILSEDELHTVLKDHRVLLALFTANDSIETAELFLRAGVPHAIAIAGQIRVTDRILFTRTLCEQLVQGNALSRAFEVALLSVAVELRQKFVLLPVFDQIHDVVLLPNLPVGLRVECLHPKAVATKVLLPPRQQLVSARLMDIYRILNRVKHTPFPVFCSLYGIPGVGKTSVANALAHYMNDRCTVDQAVWLSMEAYNVVKREKLSITFIAYLARCLNPEWANVILVDRLIGFVSGKDHTIGRPKRILVVIDGVENFDLFHDDIVTILKGCPNVMVHECDPSG